MVRCLSTQCRGLVQASVGRGVRPSVSLQHAGMTACRSPSHNLAQPHPRPPQPQSPPFAPSRLPQVPWAPHGPLPDNPVPAHYPADQGFGRRIPSAAARTRPLGQRAVLLQVCGCGKTHPASQTEPAWRGTGGARSGVLMMAARWGCHPVMPLKPMAGVHAATCRGPLPSQLSIRCASRATHVRTLSLKVADHVHDAAGESGLCRGGAPGAAAR